LLADIAFSFAASCVGAVIFKLAVMSVTLPALAGSAVVSLVSNGVGAYLSKEEKTPLLC